MTTLIYISLGTDCAVAYNLEQLDLKKASLPFDWVRTPSIEIITKLLLTGFRDFLRDDQRSLQFTKLSEKFTAFDSQNDTLSKEIVTHGIYRDMATGIIFYHDFGMEYISEQEFLEVRGKYTRRIERFLELLALANENNNKVIFIRDEHKLSRYSPDKYIEFIQTINKLYPKLNFKLIVIVLNPKKKNLQSVKNRNLQIFEDYEPYRDWTRTNFDWMKIFLA